MIRVLKMMFSWRGTIDRFRFAAIGVALIVVKVLLDRQLAHAFDRQWDWFSYWTFRPPGTHEVVPPGTTFYVLFALTAVPFLLAGLSLTFRRLRDASLPLGFVVLFFVPAVNLFFFVILALVPARSTRERLRTAEPPAARIAARYVPASRLGSAIAGAGLAALVGLLAVRFGTGLETYAIGLFVASPFCIGLLASLVYGYREPRDAGEMILVGQIAAAIIGLGMLAFAWEGVLCLVMASPLILGLVALGSLTAYYLQRGAPRMATPLTMVFIPVLLPLLLAGEAHHPRTAPLHKTVSSIVIDAPPSVVWNHVLEFPKLGKPRSVWLNLGVAHPVGATITGHGVGAIRRCVFTTGPFIEPITTWDEPRLLAFGVRSQPPTMKELSPWGNFKAPHLQGFLRSRRGEFRLTALPHGKTLLVGTTWYQNRMWPQAYWGKWSDMLIHDIHSEVLRQVKTSSEHDPAAE